MPIDDRPLEVQLVAVTNELAAAHRNLAECYVHERLLANTTYAAGTWASIKESERAIDIACAGIRNDISRYLGIIAGLEATHRTLIALISHPEPPELISHPEHISRDAKET